MDKFCLCMEESTIAAAPWLVMIFCLVVPWL